MIGLRLVCRNRFGRLNNAALSRRTLMKNMIRATAEHLGSASGPTKQNGRPHYHPFEEINEAAVKNSDGATLTAAETSRTIIKVHNALITESTFRGMAINVTNMSVCSYSYVLFLKRRQLDVFLMHVGLVKIWKYSYASDSRFLLLCVANAGCIMSFSGE